MSAYGGGRTPRTPRTPMTPYPPPDTAAVNDLLQMMKSTLNTLGATFDNLGEQSAKVASLGPAIDSAHQIHQLRRQMRAQDKKQDARINDVKYIVRDVLKDQIADHMRAQIAEQIKAEIALQVEEQVKDQLFEHLPISLEDQAAQSARQLAEVRCSLTNSEARRANAILRSTSLEDPLAVIVRADGSASDLFPDNLKTLFSYDEDTARRLVRDYGMADHEVREKNLNRFMAHCGVGFHLIPVPHQIQDSSDPANALGLSM